MSKLDELKDEFQAKLSKLEQEASDKITQYEQEIVKTQAERETLKAQEVANEKKLYDGEQRLKDKSNELDLLKKQLSDEVSEQNRLNKEIAINAEKIRVETDNIALERKLTNEELEKQKKITQNFLQKTEALKSDFSLLDNHKKTLVDRENILKAKERILNEKELVLNEKETGLTMVDLDLKAKQKRIEFEIKKLKAE